MRKTFRLLGLVMMSALLLIGCGRADSGGAGNAKDAVINQEADAEISKENNQEADDQASQEANQAVSEEISNRDNTIQEKNQLSMYIGGATGMDGVWETDNGKSVVITFDEEKVRISPDCTSPERYAWFEYIEDPGSTLEITCVDASEQTIQEMYDTVLDGKGSAWTKSELYEVNVNGMVFWCWDLFLSEKLERTEFAYETDNGHIVRNYNGYSEHTGTVSQVDLLQYVFVNIESGGSTVVEYRKGE